MNSNVEKRLKEIEEQHEQGDAKKRVCSWVEQQVPYLLSLCKAQREALEKLKCTCGAERGREPLICPDRIPVCIKCQALAFDPSEVRVEPNAVDNDGNPIKLSFGDGTEVR